MSYRTGVPLDEDCVQTGAVEILSYLDRNGVERYRVRVDGDASLSSTLGLLRMAEHEIVAMSDWQPGPEE